jgi:hypothetical protein
MISYVINSESAYAIENKFLISFFRKMSSSQTSMGR